MFEGTTPPKSNTGGHLSFAIRRVQLLHRRLESPTDAEGERYLKRVSKMTGSPSLLSLQAPPSLGVGFMSPDTFMTTS